MQSSRQLECVNPEKRCPIGYLDCMPRIASVARMSWVGVHAKVCRAPGVHPPHLAPVVQQSTQGLSGAFKSKSTHPLFVGLQGELGNPRWGQILLDPSACVCHLRTHNLTNSETRARVLFPVPRHD